MPEPPPRRRLSRVLAAWAAAWLLAGAFYELLIDTTDLPELYLGAAAATLASLGWWLAREPRTAGERIRSRWLVRAHRPIVRAPLDIVLVSAAALAQLVRRERSRGVFRAVPFTTAGSDAEQAGRGALAQGLGSFAPNTVVVGVDSERGLILAHQLRRTGGRDAIDLLELG